MSELRVFEMDVNGIPHTFQLSKADAEARSLDWSDGGEAVTTEEKQAEAVANKARTAANKAR